MATFFADWPLWLQFGFVLLSLAVLVLILAQLRRRHLKKKAFIRQIKNQERRNARYEAIRGGLLPFYPSNRRDSRHFGIKALEAGVAHDEVWVCQSDARHSSAAYTNDDGSAGVYYFGWRRVSYPPKSLSVSNQGSCSNKATRKTRGNPGSGLVGSNSDLKSDSDMDSQAGPSRPIPIPGREGQIGKARVSSTSSSSFETPPSSIGRFYKAHRHFIESNRTTRQPEPVRNPICHVPPMITTMTPVYGMNTRYNWQKEIDSANHGLGIKKRHRKRHRSRCDRSSSYSRHSDSKKDKKGKSRADLVAEVLEHPEDFGYSPNFPGGAIHYKKPHDHRSFSESSIVSSAKLSDEFDGYPTIASPFGPVFEDLDGSDLAGPSQASDSLATIAGFSAAEQAVSRRFISCEPVSRGSGLMIQSPELASEEDSPKKPRFIQRKKGQDD